MSENTCALCAVKIPESNTVYGQFCKECADVLAI